MPAFSTLRSVAYTAAIASVVGFLNTSVFANDANTASVLRELGNASTSAEAFSSNAQSGVTARARHRGTSQEPTHRVLEGAVSSSRQFDDSRLGHN